jgi:hypothetical protein
VVGASGHMIPWLLSKAINFVEKVTYDGRSDTEGDAYMLVTMITNKISR